MTFQFWGKWDEPLLCASFWVHYYQSPLFKKLGLLGMTGQLKCLYPNYYYWTEDWNYVESKVIQELRDSKKSLFDQAFKIIKKNIQDHEKLGRKIEKLDLNSLTENEQKKLVIKFLHRTREMVSQWVLVFQLASGVEKYLRQNSQEIDFTDVFAMINPPRDTLLVKQEKMFHKLWDEFKKKNLLTILKEKGNNGFYVYLGQKYPSLYKKTNYFLKEYAWVGTHAMGGKGTTPDNFLERMLTTQERPKHITPKIKVPLKIKLAVKFGSELSYDRLFTAEVFDQVNYLYRPLLDRISQQYFGSKDIFMEMSYKEIIRILQGEKMSDIKARQNGWAIKEVQGTEIIFVGRELEEELKQHHEKIEQADQVKGVIAFKGKVIGPAKIVSNPHQVEKVNEGDIIIAPETTPDLIVAMRKAAAFVTDLGGITSHAAIVAREMKKPCIVGTRIGTKIFRDGDLVEVDAIKGIIKILRKA